MPRVLSLYALLLLTGCVNLGLARHEVRFRVEERPEYVAVDVWEPLPPRGEVDANHIVFGLLAWPADALISLGYAVAAPFQSDYRIRWGPVGALCAVVMPYLTLAPPLKVPPPLAQHPRFVTPLEFEQLRHLASRGDHAGVRRVLRDLELWYESWEPTDGVRVGDDRIDRLIRQGRDAMRR